ncbi:MAG: hypothetical protein J6J43_04335 [Oscillospiraceae bacterium]|nr:hypothetical protein [Oscillospiraceae bacterium]
MHKDTIALLGDCTAGIDMAVSTMDGLLPNTKDLQLRQKLQEGISDHQLLREQACSLLQQYGGQEKAPNPMAKSMAWLKTNTRMAVKSDDTTVAYLVADGCDMGIKSLSKSRNRYSMADRNAIDLAQELIRCEESLSASLRPYL